MLRFSTLRAAVLAARKRSKHVLVSAGLLLVAASLLPAVTAQAQAHPAPVVTIKESKVVSIGEDFTLKVTFANVGDVGYGPYVDLFLPAIGIDGETQGGPCDGITFLSAKAQFASPSAYPLPAATAGHQIVSLSGQPICRSAVTATKFGPPPVTNISAHPYAALGATLNGSMNLNGPNGYELVVLELPFTSYFQAQGPITIEVKLHLSDYADAGGVLSVYARGGFRYDNSTGVSPTLVQGPFASVDITPNVVKLKKTCALPNGTPCPEDETATGPSFPFNYVISADVDTGLTVNNLEVKDCLDNNLQFVSMVSVSASGNVTSTPSVNHPGGCLDVTFPGTITGVPGPDASVVLQVYVPKFHADGTPILGDDCGFRQGVNQAQVLGSWTPLDPRDLNGDNSVTDQAEHVILKKCLAVQKSVSPTVAKPGDPLTYTVHFQVSDYFTLGSLVLHDLLSDGQTFSPSSPVLLTIGSNSAQIPSQFVTANSACNPSQVPPWSQFGFPPYPWLTSPHGGGPPAVGTVIDFDLSGALASLASSNPGWSPLLSGGTTGTITFRTTVADMFHCPVPGDDQFVDKFDRVFNYLTVGGDVINHGATVGSATDDSGTRVDIAADSIAKCVYQIDRAPNAIGDVLAAPGYCDPVTPLPSPLPKVAPGDRITFRIQKKIPASDWEQLTVADFLPSPLLSFSSLSFLPSDSCPGPSNDIQDPATNSETLVYGDYNDPNNSPCTVDALVTATVSGDLFPDHLVRNNQATECEKNSFGELICQVAVAPFELGEPVLNIHKGAIAACQPGKNGFCPPASSAYGAFSPPGVGLSGVTPPGSNGLRFTGMLASPPHVASSVTVDAGDLVTFATVVENTGSSQTGAFDVKMNDIAPFPTSNLFVSDGAGHSFNCDTAPGTDGPFPSTAGTGCTDVPSIQNFFGSGIYLDDGRGPSAADAGGLDRYGPTGTNIAVATYDMKVPGDVVVGTCFTNTTQLLNYAGAEGGANHVDPAHPLQANAQICIRAPSIEKSIVSTSEAHTSTANGVEQLAIGEIVRYHLKIMLPEGVAPGFAVRDLLPPGLRFLPGSQSIQLDPAIQNPHGVTVSGGASCGAPAVFDFGDLTNNAFDANDEFIDIEFNAQVCNVAPNQAGIVLPNKAEVSVDTNRDGNPDLTVGSNTVNAVIVEPKIAIKKTVKPGDKPNTYVYAVNLTNIGTAAAFDIVLQDPLTTACKSKLLDVALPGGAGAHILPGAGVNVGVNSLAVGASLDILYTVAFDKDCSPKACPVVNNAVVTWTSLPGPQGTSPNPTGSSTAGASGAPNGERNGSTAFAPYPPNSPEPPNDYHASAAVNLCGTLCVEKLNAANSQPLSGWNISIHPGAPPYPLITGAGPTCSPQFVGSYTLSETPQPNWSPDPPGSETQTIDVLPDQTTTVTFVNKPKSINLKITKSVVPGPNAPPFNVNVPTFPFTLSCSSTGSLPSFHLNNGGGHVQSVLAGNSCVLTESMPVNWPTPKNCRWEVSYPGGSGAMPPGPVQINVPPGTSSVPVTNRLVCKEIGGSIDLIKKVDNQTGVNISWLHYPVDVSCASGFADTTVSLLDGQPATVGGVPIGVDCKVNEEIDQVTAYSAKICPPGETLHMTTTNHPAGYVHAGDTVVVNNKIWCEAPPPPAACATTEGKLVCDQKTGRWTYQLYVSSPGSWINTVNVAPLSGGMSVIGGPFTLNPAVIPLSGAPGSTGTIDVCGFNSGEAAKGGPYDCCHVKLAVTIPKTACGPRP